MLCDVIYYFLFIYVLPKISKSKSGILILFSFSCGIPDFRSKDGVYARYIIFFLCFNKLRFVAAREPKTYARLK